MERTWTPWLKPVMVAVNVAVFVIMMRVNNCPEYNTGFDGDCVLAFLGPFSFQPLYQEGRSMVFLGPVSKLKCGPSNEI
ncbi:hypothetical protein V2J09_000599 [Rumex salicifolius]